MPRPSKSTAVLKSEGKSHRTKKELEQREKAEQAQLTGQKMREARETRDDKAAHAEFLRIRKLFEAIGKNDALYEGVINRYCALAAECKRLQEMRLEILNDLDTLRSGDMPRDKEFYKLALSLQNGFLSLDKQIQTKRKMMLEIERECSMTVASAMRSVPKKEDDRLNPLLEALRDPDG